MRGELGVSEPGLERLIRAAYDLLGLITFFTAHAGAEARARSLRERRDRVGRGGPGPHRHPGRASCAPR